VNDLSDTFDGVCDTHCSIRDVAHEANHESGDDIIEIPANSADYTISLACSGGPENNNQCGDIDLYDADGISSTLTIRGTGVGQLNARIRSVLTGAARERLFHIPEPTGERAAPKVIFEDVVLLDGFQRYQTNDTFGGGCIGNEGGEPLEIHGSFLQDCSRSSTTQDVNGGGCVSTVGDLVIEDSRLQGCTSINGPGGAVHAGGDASMHWAWFTSNGVNGSCASCAMGGAVYIATSAVVSVFDSRFEGNESLHDGGAFHQAAGNLSMTKARLRDNTSVQGRGGALYGGAAQVTLTQCELSENSAGSQGGAAWLTMFDDPSPPEAGEPAETSFIRRSSFWDNVAGTYAQGRGGALYLVGQAAAVTNSILNTTFSGNAAQGTSGRGGAIYLGGSAEEVLTTLNLYHVTLEDHDAAAGREIFLDASGPPSLALEMFNSILFASDPSDDCDGLGTWSHGDGANNATFQTSSFCLSVSSSFNNTRINLPALLGLTYNGANPTKLHPLDVLDPKRTHVDDPLMACAEEDQHGTLRATTECSAGAFEAP